ncbi:hypothetical protein ADL06_08710 [Streptomyces sp. NRRL F-6491]|nr:hypothetical protein ADL06_08710 [Streptomyces sp. NRRL F-6491]KOX37136.1 hypothetical protein ADL08_30430 [Streptomyces sp. NRRL F-6492]
MYRDHVDEEPVLIELTPDQAFVLSDWLYEVMMESGKLDAIVPDRAVWSGIYAISGTLEKKLAGIFAPDYEERLAAARGRLTEAMGGGEQ